MTSTAPALRIGTRGSPLALFQAHAVRDALCAAHGFAPDSIAIEVVRTSGDMIQDRSLAEIGGKSLFIKELEEALLTGTIDLAVHSAKDVPTRLPDGLMLAACLPREDARDAFISDKSASLAELPKGARLGTSSPRRQALAKRLRPDLVIVSLRGNVETRLRKISEGVADATLLAFAGLKRLNMPQIATRVMSEDEFLPAGGQGAITVEVRASDSRIVELIRAIDHTDTSTALAAERAFLDVLDGTCRTPIAVFASIDGDSLRLRGIVARPDGGAAHDIASVGSHGDAVAIGGEAGRDILRRAGPRFLA